MLNATGIEHFYGRRHVLSIESLELGPGTVTSLVGPNGAGKSTLLRILAFVEQPRAGTLRFDRRPVTSRNDRRQARRRVTLVEQRPLLFPGSVRDNVLYALSLHNLRGTVATDRADPALDRAGVGELAHREARDLSEGETQRVALARAIALQPAVLLLDEPVAGADRTAVIHLSQVLEQERDRGTAICLASHQLEDAYRWSSRLIALTHGRTGPVTPENLFRAVIPEGTGARQVAIGPLSLQVITDKSGPATIALPADDIIVSRERIQSSARNQFTGQIVKISDHGRGGVSLTVNVGVDLVAHVTRQAVEELGLQLGTDVVLSIKAMAVEVF